MSDNKNKIDLVNAAVIGTVAVGGTVLAVGGIIIATPIMIANKAIKVSKNIIGTKTKTKDTDHEIEYANENMANNDAILDMLARYELLVEEITAPGIDAELRRQKGEELSALKREIERLSMMK